MKVTKFPQSCLLLQKEGQSIVIDPGEHFLKTHKTEELKNVAAVLYTHLHSDHYEPRIAQKLHEWGVAMYANATTAALIAGHAHVVHDDDSFQIASFNVRARELPHSRLADGSEGPQNTGYVIDDVFFHPGDGKEIEGLQTHAMAVPIIGPDISILDAVNFMKQLNVKVAIPIHYDGIQLNPHDFVTYAEKGRATCEVRVLADGASTDV